MSEQSTEDPVWFVLNHIGGNVRNSARKSVDCFNASSEEVLELFAPTYVTRIERQGETKFRTVQLTFHYVFVRGTLHAVKDLCSRDNGFSFLIDHGSDKRYAIIPDNVMAQFMTITRAYRNCLPYYPLDDIDLESGDLVEVVKGDFPGLRGYYMPIEKSNSGNIVLRVFNKVGTMAFNVRASDVRVLEFSIQSRRANDQMDAFVPHLLAALRLFDSDQPLPTRLAAKLSVFCGRLDETRMNNRKLDARLQILLYAANTIIGNLQASQKALLRFRRLEPDVTNEWTKGLARLLTSVIDKNRQSLRRAYEELKPLEAGSRSKQLLIKEYEHYMSL